MNYFFKHIKNPALFCPKFFFGGGVAFYTKCLSSYFIKLQFSSCFCICQTVKIGGLGFIGGQVVEPDEPERKQGNMLVKHSDVIQYVFLNGVACIIAERYKESKPLSPNAYLVFDEHGNFAKRI